MQVFVDEGYDSFSVGRNKIESALETLCSKRNDFYDTSSDCSTNSKKENFRSWDEIFDTVERFSHNTTTFLSWVEEFKEVQHIKFDKSRDKRPSVNNWNKCVLDHLYRVYNKIVTDGEKLQKDFQQEGKLVSLILKNVAEEYENVASGCYGAMMGPPFEKKSMEDKKCETANSLLSSTLIYDLKKRKDRLPKDRQRLKLWWILIREREEALSWINEIRRKIDTLEIYYPQQRLRTLYKKYLIEIRERRSFKNSLKIIFDFISEIFPELSHRSEKLVYETNQAQVELENYVMKKLIVMSPSTDHKAKPNAKHQHKTHNQNYSLTSLKRKQTILNKNYKANRKESNKDAETNANKIISANNTISDRENHELNPYNFSEETLRLHHWLKDSEIKAIELFSTKPIGWNPDTLSKFLSKNKMMQNEIIENEKILKTMEIESKLYKNRLQSDEETTTTLDTTNLQWALLMLRQRTSTLSMFCLDVQCLIERRFDVTKLLNKRIKIDKLNHPIEDVWSELAIKMTKDDITVDKDYSV